MGIKGEFVARGHGAGDRIAWVDAARGTSVLLVVAFHVILWHVDNYSTDLWEPAATLWGRLNDILGSVRIPLLLGVSGMLAGNAIRAGWADHRNVQRAASNYYLYVIWLVVYAVFFGMLQSPQDLPHRISGVGDLLAQLIVPDTTLWYVFALAVYTLVFALVRGVPGWIQIAATIALTVLVRLSEQDLQALKVAEVAVFFAIGVHLGPALRRLADSANIVRVLGAAVIAIVVTLGGRVLTGELGGSLLFVGRGVAFLAFMVLSVAVVARIGVLGAALALVGRNTLPIYVIHPLVIYGVMALEATSDSRLAAGLSTPALALGYPVIVVALACVASLGLRFVLRRVGLGFLFELPRPLRDRLGSRTRA